MLEETARIGFLFEFGKDRPCVGDTVKGIEVNGVHVVICRQHFSRIPSCSNRKELVLVYIYMEFEKVVRLREEGDRLGGGVREDRDDEFGREIGEWIIVELRGIGTKGILEGRN